MTQLFRNVKANYFNFKKMLKSLKEKKKRNNHSSYFSIYPLPFPLPQPRVVHVALQTYSLCSGAVPPLTLLVNAGASTAEPFLLLITGQFSCSTLYPALSMNQKVRELQPGWGWLLWPQPLSAAGIQQWCSHNSPSKRVRPSSVLPARGVWDGCGSGCLRYQRLV